MAYNKGYIKQEWIDLPDETTPLSAERLNHLEEGIDGCDTRIAGLDESKADRSIYGNQALSLGRKKNTTAGIGSAALGDSLTVEGTYCMGQGVGCKVPGYAAAAFGIMTESKRAASYTEGSYTIAASDDQHVQGRFNVADDKDQYAHIVGNGTNASKRANIHTLDWQGNGWYAGDVTNGQGVCLNSLKTAIDLLGQFHAEIVETLPEETISTGTIYMILKPAGGSTGDIYDEYINVDGTVNGWEFIGSTSVDLTDYAKKTEIPDKTSLLTNDSGFVTADAVKNIQNQMGTLSDLTVDVKNSLVDAINRVNSTKLSTTGGTISNDGDYTLVLNRESASKKSSLVFKSNHIFSGSIEFNPNSSIVIRDSEKVAMLMECNTKKASAFGKVIVLKEDFHGPKTKGDYFYSMESGVPDKELSDIGFDASKTLSELIVLLRSNAAKYDICKISIYINASGLNFSKSLPNTNGGFLHLVIYYKRVEIRYFDYTTGIEYLAFTRDEDKPTINWIQQKSV